MTQSQLRKMKSLLSKPLTSLFDCNAINMEGVILQEFAVKKFSLYESCLNQDLYDRITEITTTSEFVKYVKAASNRQNYYSKFL